MAREVLCFGEVLWDVYPDKRYIGGAPFNFAAHLAKHNEHVHLLSAVGEDALGTETLACLKERGVDAEYTAVLPQLPTGQSIVTLDEHGVPRYNLIPDVAYDRIPCEAVPDACDVLYFGIFALRSAANFEALKQLVPTHHFKEIFVDINIRPPYYSEESVRFAAEHATMIKISDEELPIAANLLAIRETEPRAFAERLSAAYPNLRCILITCGADGAYAFDCINKKEAYCESVKAPVQSTVGAGDSFSAAFLHRYGTDDLGQALRYAVQVSGFVVTQIEAIPDYNPADFA